MKRLFVLLFTVLFFALSAICAAAVTTEFAESGKTVITVGDWVYEKTGNGTQWELDEYIGEGGMVYVPRFYADSLVVSLGNHCFANNTGVTQVVTSSPLWTIGEYVFIDCTSLETIELNPALNSIGIGAFSGTSSLKSVNLQDSIVTKIEPYTFLNSGVEQIALPGTCTELTHDCFAQCYQLTRVDIPDSVTTIHEDAFRQSENVVIYCTADSYAHEYAEANGIDCVLTDVVTFLLGDADGNGKVEILDATKIQRVLAALDSDADGMIALRGDADDDGLNILDATKVQRYLAGFVTNVPIGTEVVRVITHDNGE